MVPEIVPSAPSPAAKLLTAAAGSAPTRILRLSASATVPLISALPPATETTSASRRVTPSRTVTVVGLASAARIPCKVAPASFNSTVTLPSAILARPAALTGMALTCSLPSNPVHAPSRSSVTLSPSMRVPPELITRAPIWPATSGACM